MKGQHQPWLLSRSTRRPGSTRAPTKPAVDELEIEIEDGEFLVLVGPSGCGKSTSLRMLAGLEDVNGGAIRIGDRDVTHLPPKDRDIAMVFQNYALYPHMTVADNMGFALKIAGVNKAEIRKQVEEAAKILDLTEYLDRKPKALSGGQRQRVAMGRAIVREPQVFLMDEPLSNLDAKLRVADPYADRRAPAPARHHHRLRHPRPGRGHDDGRPRGGAQGRSAPAGRLAAQHVRPPGQPLRRRLHRLPRHEPGRGPDHRRRREVRQQRRPVNREALHAAADKGDRTVTVGVRPEHFDIVEQDGERREDPRRSPRTPRPVSPSPSTSSRSSAPTAIVYGTAEVGGEQKDLVVRVGGRAVPDKGTVLHVVPRAGETHVFSTSTGERLSD